MDLLLWREFVAFSQYMNISQTAKHLHIAQPTLSTHLAALEREVGATLIVRDKTLRLTPAGRVFLKHAVDVLAGYDKTIDAVRNAPEDELSLTVFSNGGSCCGNRDFMYVVNRFLSSQQVVGVKNAFSGEANVFNILQDTSIDCVIAYVTPLATDVEAGIAFCELPSLGDNRMGLWIDKELPLAAKETLHWADCNDLMFPLYVHTPLWTGATQQMLSNHGVSYDYRILTGSSYNCLFELAQHEALLLDEYAAKSDYYAMHENRTFVLLDEPDAISRTYLAYREDRVCPALALLLDYVRAL